MTAGNDFYGRVAAFHNAALACIAMVQPMDDRRAIAAFRCGLMSVEHASGALALLSIGLPSPALALLRPQFETLVRGIWLLYAADEKWVAQYFEPLTETSAVAGDKAPGMALMLDALSAVEEPSARAVIGQLLQYRDLNWKALNSYTHGGMHPMARSGDGYPDELVENVLKNANGLVCVAAQLAAVVSGDADRMEPVRQLHRDFADCIPLA
ncbi:DUF6988 domain-containing protein [Cupriavidus respiraculi]|uniref:Uncharacterized protein n=1 Tax=Cupriavidus respiraculi TaxID=195930 RepID=A0ABM8XUN5_9BURK|nr:hypothetical protein [Cupriavidus respiraculi]MBY4949559.1 hypothetical protein [Cupriavidus respiraculi]CAG9184081.1 hypothetical protein LMG21510_05018 [Cupriavidus respiraculi]